jgi:hypothetical protein
MSTQNDGPEFTIVLAEAVTELFTNIKLDSAGKGILTTGVASEDGTLIGPAQELGAIGDSIRVRNASIVASSKQVATGAFSAGARVHTMASGRVDDVVTSLTCTGVAKTAATAAGDVIEVINIAGSNDDLT